MRKQLITVAGSIAAIIFAFVAGTAIASHLSSHGSNNNTNTNTNTNNNGITPGSGFGSGTGRPNFPGGGGFFGTAARNGTVGRVTSVSGDSITISSFSAGTEKVIVNSSTTYSKRTFTAGTLGSSSATLADIKTGSFILAQGSKSNGEIVAKSVTIMSGGRPGFGHFRPGQGNGFQPGGTFTPPSGSQTPSQPGI